MCLYIDTRIRHKNSNKNVCTTPQFISSLLSHFLYLIKTFALNVVFLFFNTKLKTPRLGSLGFYGQDYCGTRA